MKKYQAILFDLDGTLLHMEQEPFMKALFKNANVYANGDVLASAIRGAARTTVSTAEELEFKYYESKGFTETDDATENTIYRTDADGNMIWVTEADGTSHRVVVRVIHPITATELTVWTSVLTLIPLVLLGGLGTYMYLRRRSR